MQLYIPMSAVDAQTNISEIVEKSSELDEVGEFSRENFLYQRTNVS